jgi:hypothetical protein
MLNAIRSIARKADNALSTCINPLCLHNNSTRNPKCACCRKGCGKKPASKSSRKR